MNILFNKNSRTEIIRAMDLFSLFTNSSHAILDFKRYPKKVEDFGGNIIFHTRLWNPNNHANTDEKEVENFKRNLEKLSSNRSAYQELPEKIEYLLSGKKYLEMGQNNLLWSENYLHPKNYIKRILTIVEKNTKIELS
ncbi:hypothetical protein [Flavobacterium sp. UBA4854]|uniref:hypothetical protein n=1 Tax=Flavobacterium sp. UBA4854 TaxID=1946548 RepID=UPI00257C283A|nr:hypothetical protein [Flavobacterium sp. UBA4854]